MKSGLWLCNDGNRRTSRRTSGERQEVEREMKIHKLEKKLIYIKKQNKTAITKTKLNEKEKKQKEEKRREEKKKNRF